uniref:Uncharacterized protein n=1 Tax=Arundo donax TaxID=35708 RepID=A0A0A9B582_ARUDO
MKARAQSSFDAYYVRANSCRMHWQLVWLFHKLTFYTKSFLGGIGKHLGMFLEEDLRAASLWERKEGTNLSYG